jgi:DNA-binding MarR family transcriptional regulator
MGVPRPLTTDWSKTQVVVMRRLGDWAVAFNELNGHLSRWMRLPTADANALGQIVWAEQSGQPLSPARLAQLIGMTTGATSVLIDRLEAAGHVKRTREERDRRRVTLRPTVLAKAESDRFLAFAGQEIARLLSDARMEDVRIAADFLAHMTEAAATANSRLRRNPGTAGESVTPDDPTDTSSRPTSASA